MPDVRMSLRRRVATYEGRKELIQDDAGALRLLIDSIDYGRGKYRSMRRSMDRLYDQLVPVTTGQMSSEDATAFISVTPEQIQHLHEVAQDPPSEGQNATVRIMGSAMRKLLNAIDDTWEEWKKEQDGKPETKGKAEPEVRDSVPAEG